MTAAELLRAPVAARQPERTLDQLRADDAQLRMLSAPTPELRDLWAGRLAKIRGVAA